MIRTAEANYARYFNMPNILSFLKRLQVDEGRPVRPLELKKFSDMYSDELAEPPLEVPVDGKLAHATGWRFAVYENHAQ